MQPERVAAAMEPERDAVRLDILRWAPLIKILVLLIGSGISFPLAYFKGHVSIYLPFISETGAHVPEMFVFSLSLYLGSTIGIVIIFYQYLIMRFRLTSQQEKLQSMNRTTSICGLISMIGLAGVAVVPMSTVLWVHLVFAGIHFSFAVIYASCMTFTIFFVPGGDTSVNRIRMALCAILLLLLISLVVLFPLAQFKWYKATDKLPALKTPKDRFFNLMLASTALEWATYAVYLTIIGSLYFEFREYTIEIGVHQINVRPRVTGAEN